MASPPSPTPNYAESALKKESSISPSAPSSTPVWDLWPKVLPKPVWRIVAAMSPEEFVRCIDFRYISDAITPREAIEVLRKEEAGTAQRLQDAENSHTVPALHRLNLTTLSLLEGFDVTGVELRAARTFGCTYPSYDTWPH